MSPSDRGTHKKNTGPRNTQDRPERGEAQSSETAVALVQGEERERGSRTPKEPPRSEGMLPIEDGSMEPPVGSPKSLGPKCLEPLFDDQQIQKAEDMARKAPLINPSRSPSPGRELGWDGGLGRKEAEVVPSAIEAMMMKSRRGMLPRLPGPSSMPAPPGFNPGMPPGSPGYPHVPQWLEDQLRLQWQTSTEMTQFSQVMKQLQEENLRLRVQLMEERELKYSTPPEGIEAGEKDRGKKGKRKEDERTQKKSSEDHRGRPLKKLMDGSVEARGKEDLWLVKGRREEKEDGSGHQQEKMRKKDASVREGRRKEDGSEHQQGNSARRSAPIPRSAENLSGRSERRSLEPPGYPSSAQSGGSDAEWNQLMSTLWKAEPEETIVEEEEGPGRQQDEESMKEDKEDGSGDRQDEKVSELSSSGEEEQSRSESEDDAEGTPCGKEESKNPGQDKAWDVMLKLMEGMQHLQKQILDNKMEGGRKGGQGGVDDEQVRGGMELPSLPEWSPDSAPVDLQDWLLVLHPQMSDLSSTSQEWWEGILQAAKDWYKKHQSMRPIEKLQHTVVTPPALNQQRWMRLERRASNLLLKALPMSQREEIVATKDITVLGILTKLMVNYQPGGGQEKAAVLAALESPTEATSIGESVVGLRRWLRWKKRAEDINVVLPDPTVLLRGLDRLVGKVLQSNPTLQFAINLTRSALRVDSVPTMQGVESLAECLLAELDQVSYAKRKLNPNPGPKVRKFDGERQIEGEEAKKDDAKKDVPKCRFYLTENGCRKGKQCRWSHDQKDEQKRCWTCGATTHFSPKCPVKDGPQQNPPKPKVAKAEKEKDNAAKSKKAEEEDAKSDKAALGPGEDMRVLLEEAGRMLKSMPHANSDSSSNEDGEARIRSLQRQLDDLKAP